MPQKRLFFFAVVLSIFLFGGSYVSASVTYSRSSSGASVSSPVSFDVSFTNFAQDVGETEGTVLCNDGIGGEQACRYWGVMINGAGSLEVGSGESFPSTTLSGHFEVDLPVGFDATLVSFIYCFNQADCNAATPTGTPTTGGGAYLEGNGTGVIFRVLAAQNNLEIIRELKIQILKLQIKILELQLQALLKQL